MEIENAPIRPLTRKVYPYDHHDSAQLRRTGPMPRIKVDPYSMRHSTPQQRANDIMGFVTNVYAPLAQVAQQQGLTFDFKEFLSIIGGLKDMPEYKRIIKSVDMPMQEEQPSPSQAAGGKPAETTRNYVRRSLGGNSKLNQDAKVDAMLAASASESNGQMQRS